MPATQLSETAGAHLPQQRPRWLCHLVAFVFLVLTLAVFLVLRDVAHTMRRDQLTADSVHLLAMGLPGLLLLPAYRRVSFRKRDALFFLLQPIWGLVIVWKVGFRLTSLPYRDWPPRPDEYARCRSIPGTSYHVVLPEAVSPDVDAPSPA